MGGTYKSFSVSTLDATAKSFSTYGKDMIVFEFNNEELESVHLDLYSNLSLKRGTVMHNMPSFNKLLYCDIDGFTIGLFTFNVIHINLQYTNLDKTVYLDNRKLYLMNINQFTIYYE